MESNSLEQQACNTVEDGNCKWVTLLLLGTLLRSGNKQNRRFAVRNQFVFADSMHERPAHVYSCESTFSEAELEIGLLSLTLKLSIWMASIFIWLLHYKHDITHCLISIHLLIASVL